MVRHRNTFRAWRDGIAKPRTIRNGVHGASVDETDLPPLDETDPYRLRFSWRKPIVVLAFFFCSAVMFVNAVDPYSGATASPYFQIPRAASPDMNTQDVTATGGSQNAGRDQFTVEDARLVIPAQGVPDPESAKAIGFQMVMERGWGADQYDCLALLWDRESNWNHFAENPSSGAYGIPQALPGDKMATVSDDWRTNPVTQITWGLRYIEARYGSPCGAWAHSEEMNWY
jgi:hypothetical protein